MGPEFTSSSITATCHERSQDGRLRLDVQSQLLSQWLQASSCALHLHGHLWLHHFSSPNYLQCHLFPCGLFTILPQIDFSSDPTRSSHPAAYNPLRLPSPSGQKSYRVVSHLALTAHQARAQLSMDMDRPCALPPFLLPVPSPQPGSQGPAKPSPTLGNSPETSHLRVQHSVCIVRPRTITGHGFQHQA